MQHSFSALNRILYSQTQPEATLTFIFIGGIHGNEPAGIYGLQKVIQHLTTNDIKLRCNFYALAGNLNALKKNIRFETTDLNRLWTHENIQKIESKTTFESAEEKEQSALYTCIQNILNSHSGSFIFIDIHTTSSQTTPFITISDSLYNRKFVSGFSVPIILGIEEHLNGALLTYINEFGHVALGFEAGQHEDLQAVKNSEVFIWQSLVSVNAIDTEMLEHIALHKQAGLNKLSASHFYQISDRYQLEKDEDFTMKAGFKNFDIIKKHQKLATSNQTDITASTSGKIFMPLYQAQGDDGFFIITKISMFWLQLSSIFRKLNFHHILRILPGVTQDKKNTNALYVNPKIAAILTTKIFHLFGYRKRILKTDVWYFMKRD